MSQSTSGNCSCFRLQTLWSKRSDWRDRAFSKIVSQLHSGQGNTSNTRDERLVVVCGLPQMGKTELILRLIGIRGDCLGVVYKQLRGDSKAGNSSTSHAILYRQSVDDFYHASWRRSVFDSDAEEKAYAEDRISGYINSLRANLVRGGDRRILSLAIPRKYCIVDEDAPFLNIVDLPGINSSDERERQQVNGLMETYARIAAVTIIVCTLNRIQDLATKINPPGEEDWMLAGDKVLLALTRAYSSRKEELKKYPGDSAALRERMREICRQEFLRVYRERYPGMKSDVPAIEIFPFEVGESLRSGCPQEMLDKISEGQRQVESALRSAVMRRQNGENLALFIRSRKKKIELDRDVSIQNLQAERAFLEKNRESNDAQQDELRKEKELLDSKGAKVKSLCETVEQLRNSSPLPQEVPDKWLRAVQYQDGLFNRRLPNKKLRESIDAVREQVKMSRKEIVCFCDKWANATDLPRKLETDLESCEEEFASAVMNYLGDGLHLFGRTEADCRDAITQQGNLLLDAWAKSYQSFCDEFSDRVYSPAAKKYKSKKAEVRRKEDDLNSQSEDIKESLKENAQLCEQAEQNMNEDLLILDRAKKIASSCYQEKRSDLIRRMKKTTTQMSASVACSSWLRWKKTLKH